MASESSGNPPSLQVLHLEDSAADRDLVQHAAAIGDLNAVFTPVQSRQDFVDALVRDRYDVILCDYTLPAYDGWAALADAQKLQPDTPLIFVSGTIGETQALEIVKAGATDYVFKSQLNRLVPSIRRAVQEARERSRREQAEQALRESEQRLREMAENIREVFWVRSADGAAIHYVSPAYEQIWGFPLAKLQAKPSGWIDAVLPEDRTRLQKALVQLGRGTAYTIEYRIIHADGGPRWIEERAFPIRNPEGGVERTVAASVDITARKQLEDQLKQAQKMESIGQLAGGIAHDFSNMLTVINGYSNLLLDKDTLPPEMAGPLKQIYVAGGRAANLTRQLLIFSRKGYTRGRAVDLNETITDITAMLRRLIGEQVSLQLDLARDLPPAFSDNSMIEQVLMNLVVNSRDAMPAGGTIVVSTGSCEISDADCAARPEAHPGGFVWVGVRDTGSGIPPDVLPRIFEPFFTTKEAGRGTGLGLATVRGIARQHGGWVEVESDMGVGTFFQVYLPIATDTRPPGSSSPPEMPSETGGKETILLVEDEEAVREFARTVLEMYGYRVLQARSGVDALEVWKWHGERVSLLLTDLVMPDDMTGIELAGKLQAQRPELKVLFSSGYGPDRAGELLAARPSYSFLHKPYQPKTLARMVREVLDGREHTHLSPSQAPFNDPPPKPA